MSVKSIIIKSLAILVSLAVLAIIAGYISLRTMGMFRDPVYDTQAPEIPELQRPALLVLHKTNGFIHKEGLPAASAMLAELAKKNGWSIYQTDNAAVTESDILAAFDVFVWNNTTGDILTESQKQTFQTWLEQGGTWLGLHAAGGDREYDWSWYRDTLIGAQFIGHTMSPQFQDASVLVADSSKLTEHLPRPWRIPQEEWYAFDRNPRASGSKILLTLDESSYDTSEVFFKEPTMPGEHPIAWTHQVGEGRIIYSGIGHQAATYSNPQYREFVARSLRSLISHRSGNSESSALAQ